MYYIANQLYILFNPGPSVIVAFLVGFIVTLLNGLCFAEYASKNPRTGAQYIYMYEAIGEAFAFIIGWTSVIGMLNNILNVKVTSFGRTAFSYSATL